MRAHYTYHLYGSRHQPISSGSGVAESITAAIQRLLSDVQSVTKHGIEVNTVSFGIVKESDDAKENKSS